jgi:uncharacterized protein (DUF2336 family)
MTLEHSLLADIEATFATGSVDRQAEILRRVTDLFLASASQYSDDQSTLFDGVILRLAEKIETKARAELANRLAPIANAPTETVRNLARDRSIEVAGPILTQSSRLTDDDLLSIAQQSGHEDGQANSQESNQAHLLAISKRATLSENVSYELVTRGNRDVLLSVSQNDGANFSDAGYGKLIDRTINDEVLAICVGMRKDIPRKHFHTLISKASQVVFEKLAASNPSAVAEVQQVLAGITGQPVDVKQTGKGSYSEAEARFESLRCSGKSADSIVQALAEGGKFIDTVAALSLLSGAPRDFVENVMSDRRGSNDFALLLAKAAGLAWPATKQICIMRRGPGGLPPLAIEAARKSFASLTAETAQRVISFYNERHTALDDFQLLAEKIREQEDALRTPRLS